jgi:transposase
MTGKEYFSTNTLVIRKKYEALKSFYQDGISAKTVAKQFGYTLSAFYSLARDFQQHLREAPHTDYFFKDTSLRKKRVKDANDVDAIIIALRKKSFDLSEIKSILDAQNYTVSESYIYRVLKQDGFDRLPRRNRGTKNTMKPIALDAPKSVALRFTQERFMSTSIGILTFLPYLKTLGLAQLITTSSYPETTTITRFSSICAFLALKLTNVRRFSADDLWCMDRGLGLFAGLNVLPKTAWFSSYSHRVTGDMNLSFLRKLHHIWQEKNLLGNTANLDFTTIPYWGDDEHLEQNWSGKRRQALSSMLAILAHDPDSGIIDYGHAHVMHKGASKVVLEYLDFYRSGCHGHEDLKFLVFDSKFTNYEHLGRLHRNEIRFVTIRRRGKKMIERLAALPQKERKKIRVECAGHKTRTLYVYEEQVVLPGYNLPNTRKVDLDTVRQLSITGHGKLKPALIITNDVELSQEDLVRKYSRRWLVEKSISEQIEFFHLNRVCSSMVIKVDFDLTMSILAHNLYRIYAKELERYKHFSDITIYEKFVNNSGTVTISDESITVSLKKKRNLPTLLTAMEQFAEQKYEFLNGKRLIFEGATNT